MGGEAIDLGARRDGCRVVLRDDGVNREVPICMGGAAIIGCTSKSCELVYKEQQDSPNDLFSFWHDDEGKVNKVTSVPRSAVYMSDMFEKTS